MASLICKTVKGNNYWYIVESKRIDGKVKQEVLEYIGNQKKLCERIMGTSSFDVKLPESFSVKSYSHGCAVGLMKVANMLGVPEILNSIIAPRKRDGVARGTSLILAAIHRAAEPGSKNEFYTWFKQTTLPYQLDIQPQVMTSQHFWEQMDGITEEELRMAEDAITAKILEKYPTSLDKLALDYTNYFTYIDTGNEHCSLAKRGKNKQRRNDLRQCSLAIVTTKESEIPLFSHVYKGNCNDQTEFGIYKELLMERLPTQEPSKTTLIFDGGSNTKENLGNIDMHYICSFSLSNCKELYQINTDAYDELELKNGKKVMASRINKEIWGKDRTCILTLSNALYKGQERELIKDINKAVEELEALDVKIKNPKSRIKKTEESLKERVGKLLNHKYMKEIIKVKITSDGLEYEIDSSKKAEIMNRYFGKKLLITDRDDWTSEEIIEAYREQDCIEKIFRESKDSEHCSVRPFYHWTDQKIRVHIFICLLGLTLTASLQKEVAKNGLKLSKNKLLEELCAIRESWIMDGSEKTGKIIKKIEVMNDTQKTLWKLIEEL